MAVFRSAHTERDAKVTIDERDSSGERVIAGRRTVRSSAVTPADLQRAVSQDLEVLMNTVNLAASIDLQAFPAARRSVLNHGFPDLVHRSLDEVRVNDVGHEIRAALLTFEPRLVADTIQVRRDMALDAAELKIRFFISADLNLDPLNVPVEFVADLERSTGKIAVTRA